MVRTRSKKSVEKPKKKVDGGEASTSTAYETIDTVVRSTTLSDATETALDRRPVETLTASQGIVRRFSYDYMVVELWEDGHCFHPIDFASGLAQFEDVNGIPLHAVMVSHYKFYTFENTRSL
jgi:hypothetical protein